MSRVRVAWEAAKPTRRGSMGVRSCIVLERLITALKQARFIGGVGKYRFPRISTPTFWELF